METRRAIPPTEVSRYTALGLTAFFVASVFLPPAWEAARIHAPLYEPAAAAFDGWSIRAGVASRFFSANAAALAAIRRVEGCLEDSSPLRRALRWRTQYALTTWLREGTGLVAVGLDGWLFFIPDLTHVTGPGFPRDGCASQVSAVTNLGHALARQGIALVVVPVPAKPQIHPEQLIRSAAGKAPVRNPSFVRWKEAVEREGVLVFDPADALVALAKRTGRPAYLATDTHWTAEAVAETARGLARFLRDKRLVRGRPLALWRERKAVVEGTGDLAAGLGLKTGRIAASKEIVWVRQVLAADGSPWRPRRDSEVLLLGDSFTNVYSWGALGFGEGAGLAEQLSAALGLPVDVISRNDAGAWGTREILDRNLARVRNWLAGKKIVVWEFASRELSHGDWKQAPMVPGQSGPRRFYLPPPGRRRAVSGTVAGFVPAPRPGDAPYADHIAAVHLTGLLDGKGESLDPDEAVVYVWTMRKRALVAGGGLWLGQRIMVRLARWSEVEAAYGAVSRGELEDQDLLAAEPCWGEILK